MKLKNIAIVAAAAALAVGMTACGSSASSTAASSSVASSAAASSEAASSEAAASEAAEPTTAEYTVYNTTGSTVTELYLYDAGSDEKGDNLAGENGLADGENIVITRDVEADKQSDVTYHKRKIPTHGSGKVCGLSRFIFCQKRAEAVIFPCNHAKNPLS